MNPNDQLSIDFEEKAARVARKLGTQAGERARSKADMVCPGFSERALEFIDQYSATNPEFTGESATRAAVAAGIKPHDTRAFGAIYAKALRDGVIRVVAFVPRANGHGSMGGKLYARGRAV